MIDYIRPSLGNPDLEKFRFDHSLADDEHRKARGEVAEGDQDEEGGQDSEHGLKSRGLVLRQGQRVASDEEGGSRKVERGPQTCLGELLD